MIRIGLDFDNTLINYDSIKAIMTSHLIHKKLDAN